MSAVLEDHVVVPEISDVQPPAPPAPWDVAWDGGDDAAGRRALREQIVRLEQQLSDVFVTGFSMGGLVRENRDGQAPKPRLLTLGELEAIRDQLAARLKASRGVIAAEADRQDAARVQLERMLRDPAQYRYVRISLADLGERGCGAYEVKPRLGVIGMLAGWWHVKISSGCP